MTEASKQNTLPEISTGIARIVESAAPSIVAVLNAKRGISSGFFWRPGIVITADEALGNHHEAFVIAGDQRREAVLVGRDQSTDIAVLKIEDQAAPAATLRPDLTVRAGEFALAIGRREQGVTARFGIVSSVGGEWRSMRGGRIDSLIRLDLTLDRSSEGSLLVDADGRGFGMAVRGPRRSVLAIPAATIERVATRILEKGSVRSGYLGLGLHPVRISPVVGGSASQNASHGLIVLGVAANGPGHAAGVLQGDIVTEWNGAPLKSLRDVFRELGADMVGQTVELSLVRGGQPLSARLVVGERPTQ